MKTSDNVRVTFARRGRTRDSVAYANGWKDINDRMKKEGYVLISASYDRKSLNTV